MIESLSDSTIYMAYYTVAHLLQGGQLDGNCVGPSGIKAEQMTVGAWDYVFLGADYDAEKCGNIEEATLKRLRNEFEFWYPMDMRVSGKDLIRNHLTMSLYNHAASWKDNLEKRMTRSYFCNGYLCLNSKKMSKSTGNFMTLRDCINKFGVESTRIALADAGDSLDDANFDEQVANAAILKLFVLEDWIEKNIVSNVDVSGHCPSKYSLWDRIVANELDLIVEKVTVAYDEMKFKLIVKHAFNEMLTLKENWLIAAGTQSSGVNPHLMNKFIETMLVILNPIIPHYCQHVW